MTGLFTLLGETVSANRVVFPNLYTVSPSFQICSGLVITASPVPLQYLTSLDCDAPRPGVRLNAKLCRVEAAAQKLRGLVTSPGGLVTLLSNFPSLTRSLPSSCPVPAQFRMLGKMGIPGIGDASER